MNQQSEEVREVEGFEGRQYVTAIDLNAPPVPIKDVLEEIMPQGEKSELAEWVDQTIVVRSVRAFTGQFGQAAFVVFTDESGTLFNMVIGSKVLLPKLVAVKKYLPVSMKLIKVQGGQYGEYYDVE